MKKIFSLAAFFLFLIVPVACFSAGSGWTAFTPACIDRDCKAFTLSAEFTADDTDATIPTKIPSTDEFRSIQDRGLLCYITYNPGATGPTNGAWDITLVGAITGNVDLSGGAATNLSSTVGQIYQTKDAAGNQTCVPVIENFAITITGNAVNSAKARVYLIFYKP